MTAFLKTENLPETKNLEPLDLSFLAHFDLIMIRILQKFYGKAVDPVNGEINSYDVQRLKKVLEKEGLKITTEGLRKKLDLLVRLGFLVKIPTYPRIYTVPKDYEQIKKIQEKIEKLKQVLL